MSLDLGQARTFEVFPEPKKITAPRIPADHVELASFVTAQAQHDYGRHGVLALGGINPDAVEDM